MVTINLAGNFIDGIGFLGVGHLQLVRIDGEDQEEIEVQAPGEFGVLGGEWVYHQRDHTNPLHTSAFVPSGDGVLPDPNAYAITQLNIQERDAAEFWQVLTNIHEEFERKGDFEYNSVNPFEFQNSNSYINTLLYMMGIDLSGIIDRATPPLVINGYPGDETNVVLDPQQITDPIIDFDLTLTNGDDYVRTGIGDDTVQGGNGNDQIDGGVGIDTAVYTNLSTLLSSLGDDEGFPLGVTIDTRRDPDGFFSTFDSFGDIDKLNSIERIELGEFFINVIGSDESDHEFIVNPLFRNQYDFAAILDYSNLSDDLTVLVDPAQSNPFQIIKSGGIDHYPNVNFLENLILPDNGAVVRTLRYGAQADSVEGRSERPMLDVIDLGGGDDEFSYTSFAEIGARIDGGMGHDVVTLGIAGGARSEFGFFIDASNSTVQLSQSGDLVSLNLSSIEEIRGGDGDDILIGDTTLYGGHGADTYYYNQATSQNMSIADTGFPSNVLDIQSLIDPSITEENFFTRTKAVSSIYLRTTAVRLS